MITTTSAHPNFGRRRREEALTPLRADFITKNKLSTSLAFGARTSPSAASVENPALNISPTHAPFQCPKVRRTAMFIESKPNMDSSSVRSGMKKDGCTCLSNHNHVVHFHLIMPPLRG